MTEPLCFSCKHFRANAPLTHLKPGECRWDPGPVPPWLEHYIWSDDYYAPKREIWSRGEIITECPVYAAAANSPSIPSESSTT